MDKELDNLNAVIKNNASVSKSLDILIDNYFFTYAYMLVCREVLSDGYQSENKAEVLKGIHLLHQALTNISKIVEGKE